MTRVEFSDGLNSCNLVFADNITYGHVLRREEEYVGKRVMVMDVTGKGRRGRPKLRWSPWLDSIRKDLSERVQEGKRKTGLNGGVS